MSITIPGLDTEKGLDLYDDEIEIYKAVLQSFVANTPVVLDSIRKVSADTLSDYAVSIHGLKSTCATIGAENARNKALELENFAKANELSEVLARNDDFIKMADSLVSNINKWLKENDT